MSTESQSARSWTPNALPSPLARALAFGAIMLGGVLGMLLGWRFTDLQCGADESIVVIGRPLPDGDPVASDSDCGMIIAVGTVAGSVIGAGGISIVAVMTLRAMSEWRKPLETE